MSARITYTCKHCKATIATRDIVEVIEWEKDHRDTCIGGAR